MPPRLNFHSVSRSLTIRSRPIVATRNPAFFNITPTARRCFAEEKQPSRNGSNEDAIGHVSEEARDIAEITGQTPPDMGRSTNVQDVWALLSQERFCQADLQTTNHDYFRKSQSLTMVLDPQKRPGRKRQSPRSYQGEYQGFTICICPLRTSLFCQSHGPWPSWSPGKRRRCL